MPDIRKVSEFGQNPFPASEKLQHDFSNTFITEQKATGAQRTPYETLRQIITRKDYDRTYKTSQIVTIYK